MNEREAAKPAPAMRHILDRSENGQKKDGHIVIGYDVNQIGRTRNVHVVASDIPGYRDELVREYVERFRFRPRFQNGEPVSFSDLHYEIAYELLEDETALPQSVAQRELD